MALNLLSDIITYVRRLVKTPSNTALSDDLLIDYINRFWIMDVDARIQLFDLKTKYQFITQPGVDRYNMPLYNIQTEPGNQPINLYPVYQGFLGPCYINGVEVSFQTQKNIFFNTYPNVIQTGAIVGVGDGSAGPYTLTMPVLPNNPIPVNPPVNAILRGHVDIRGVIATGINTDPPIAIDATALTTLLTQIPTTSIDSAVFFTTSDSTGNNQVVMDSGIFLSTDVNYGMLIQKGNAPFGNSVLPGAYTTASNTINYFNGIANVTFPNPVPLGVNIQAQYLFFQTGLPRGMLYYNNTLTLRSPPSSQFLVELDAYLSPSAFLASAQAVPYGYMTEYIARGAARKLLADTGDWEQFDRYESLFLEQEQLVWKRSQRQWTSTRSQTIYSHGVNQGYLGSNNFGGSAL